MLKRLLLLALLVPAGACASARAKTATERPALEVPPPPPRVIEPAAPVEAAQPEPVGELPPPPAAPARPRPQPREPAKEPAKPEPKVETPVEAAPPAPQPVTPVPAPQSQLRTPATADAAEAARQVREVLDRTTKVLGSIDYRVLSSERRKAYDQAKEFMQGSEGAMKEANYLFARSLADKAEKLARELQGR